MKQELKTISNIHMKPYYEDDIDILTKSDICKIVSSKDGPIIGLLKVMNFDVNKPAHNNIYFRSIKNGACDVFTYGWERLKLMDVIYIIIDNKVASLEKIFNRIGHLMIDKYKTILIDTIESFKITPDMTDTRKQLANKKMLSKYVKLCMINNNDVVKPTYNATKTQINEPKY